MNRVLLSLYMIFSINTLAQATLTNGNIPVTKNGAIIPPTLQNGSITDTGTSSGPGNVGVSSVNPGQALDVQGTVRAVAFAGNGSALTGISGSISGLTTNVVPKAGSSSTIVNGDIFDNGNVGVGSINPGQNLDVNGTARMNGLILSGNGASNGNVMVSNGIGIGTWMAASTLPISGGSSQWTTQNTTDVSLASGNVGIGTTSTTTSALTVMNGNVGIGTWIPGGKFIVNGNVGIGTNAPGVALAVGSTGQFNVTSAGAVNSGNLIASGVTSSGNIVTSLTNSNVGGSGSGSSFRTNVYGGANASSILVLRASSLSSSTTTDEVSIGVGNSGGAANIILQNNSGTGTISTVGNIGIGSVTPGAQLDVNGTVRMTGFTLKSGASSGYILTSNSVGVGTWMQATGGSSQWTTANTNDVYLPNSGNVAIGTSNTTTSALTVMNGNVGIGTWVPAQLLTVNGTVSATGFISSGSITGQNNYFASNVGIGSLTPGQALDVQGTVRALSGGSCTTLYICNGGVDVGVVQTSGCSLCPAGSCIATHGCF